MTPEDRRFLQGVYKKADAMRRRRHRAFLILLCLACGALLGAVMIVWPGSIYLYSLAGAALLSAISALQWANLKTQ